MPDQHPLPLGQPISADPIIDHTGPVGPGVLPTADRLFPTDPKVGLVGKGDVATTVVRAVLSIAATTYGQYYCQCFWGC